jgi:hypothetical protein
MYHELHRLDSNPSLQQLLSLYAESEVAVPGQWQERVTQLEGVEIRTMATLHGELLAQEWIEQNIAQTLGAEGGSHPGCYRITPAGFQALKQVLTGLGGAEDVVAGIAARKAAQRNIRIEKGRAQRASKR